MTTKSSLIIIILVLIIGLVGFSAKNYKDKYNSEQQVSQSLVESMNHLSDSTNIYKVKLNDTVSVYVNQVSALTIKKKNLEALYKQQVEELGKLNIKLGGIRELMLATTVTKDTVNTIAYVDSFGGIHANYVDSFTHIKIDIDSLRKTKIDYRIVDSLKVVDYQDEHKILWGLFKWYGKNNKIVIYSLNPKSTVTKFKVVKMIK